MRTFLLLAAMAMGGMATAQTRDQSQTGATSAQGSGQTAAPGNNNPETDARGIPVISAPAEVPAGANQAVAAAPGTPIVPAPNQQCLQHAPGLRKLRALHGRGDGQLRPDI